MKNLIFGFFLIRLTFFENGEKKGNLEAPSVPYEKIYTKFFDVNFIDENYIEAINIEDTKDRLSWL